MIEDTNNFALILLLNNITSLENNENFYTKVNKS